MKRNYRLLAGGMALIALTVACSKKYVKPNDTDPGVNVIQAGPGGVLNMGSQLNKLFKDLRSTPETQVVTAGIEQVVTFKKGTVLRFHPNSFKDKNGNIISSGTITITMVEMYSPGSMAANRATTTAKDGILKSGGQVHITAKQNGQEVYATTYGIAFPQAANDNDPMNLYYGDTNYKDSAVRWGVADTAMADSTTMAIWEPTPPLPPPPPPTARYVFQSCTKFGFINCDMLHVDETVARSPMYVRLPDESFTKYNNTEVFVILPSVKGCLLGENYYNGAGVLFQVASEGDTWHLVPVGMQATVVVISRKDEKYYYYEKTGIIVAENTSINAMPEEKSLEFIKTRLSEL